MPNTRREWIDFLGSHETFTKEEIDAWREFFISFPAPDAFRIWEDLSIAIRTVSGQRRAGEGSGSYAHVLTLFHGNMPEIREHLGKCLADENLPVGPERMADWYNLVPPS